jgi:hypothetical protein
VEYCQRLLLEDQNKATVIDVDLSVRKGGFRNAIITEVAILLAVNGYGELRQIGANRELEGSDTSSWRFVMFLQEVCVPFFRIQIE